MPIALAFVVIRQSYLAGENERRDRLRRWAIDRLATNIVLGSEALFNFWISALEHGSKRLDGIWLFKDDKADTSVLTAALLRLLRSKPNMPIEALTTALFAAARCVSRAQISELSGAALALHDVAGAQRTAWRMVAFALAPQIHFAALKDDPHIREAHSLFGGIFDGGLLARFRPGSEVDRLAHAACVIRLLGREYPPHEGFPSGRIEPPVEMSYRIENAINSLAQSPTPLATETLRELVDDPSLASWRPLLLHRSAEQQRLCRDHEWKHPTPKAVREALEGGPPVNAADLQAIALDALEGLRRQLRTADTTPWKRYWNRDQYGRPTKPLVENECCDTFLERLRDRCARFHIMAALPEARRASETRVDILVLSGAGKNLPIEIKRHNHPQLWTAAGTQLTGYAADEGADGRGIYLVFWFGTDWEPAPAREDGRAGPKSANELERMLIDDLSPERRPNIDVMVFDVSKPT
jgi:hypothetical protein